MARPYLLQVWLSEEERDALRAAVESENEELRAAGKDHLKASVSGLIRLWIRERLGLRPATQTEPESPAETRVVSSAGIDASRAALRGKR